MADQDLRPPSRPGRWSSVLRAAPAVLLFAAAFFAVQRLTFALRFPPFQRATIWTPGALLFAALLLAPPGRWWVYYAGLCLGVFAAYYGDNAIPVAAAMLAAQAFFATAALGVRWHRRPGAGAPFGNPTSLMAFVATAVLVTVITTAPIDLVRWASGADDVGAVALRSVLCGSLGLIIGTPALALTLANGPAWFRARSWKPIVESVCLAGCLVAVGYLSFNRPADGGSPPALLYAPLPLLLWAAMRFGLAGLSWALLAVAYQSTWGAVHGRGPFTSHTPAENVLQLQCFLLASSLPLMFLAVAIEEKRRGWSALSQSEERFRLVVESTPNAIVIVDAEGTIALVNSQCEKSFGYRREELVGRPAEVLVPERLRAALPGHLAGILASPPARRTGAGHDLYVRRKDGSEFPVEVGLTPLRTGEGPFVLCSLVDITGRKRDEEARQELAHASRLALVGELTASIAHEINQPLGAVVSNADAAEMLLESAPESLAEVRQILGDIRKDGLRAGEVIRRLRALLRKRQMEVQPVDLNGLTSDVLSLVRAESRRRHVTVETELAGGLPPVRGDKVHLQQVLLNLFLNGMEAMADRPGEKRLAVRTALGQCGCVEVAVSDAGTGIPQDRLPHLFDPFFSTKKEGMGVGLSIARSLVEAHGGRIWAENNPRAGATFRFALPIHGGPPDRESWEQEKVPVGTSR
jgi:two-component system sensor kinase FixL